MKESDPPPLQSISSLLRPEDKRLIWDKGFGQCSSRFTVHYDGRSVPGLTWLYICWGFMECVREEWCERCAQGWHTHLGKWWNDGRQCPLCPAHKSVCSLAHLQSSTGGGQKCWSVKCAHTNTRYHDQADSTLFLLPLFLCTPLPLPLLYIYSISPYLKLSPC